MSTVDADIEIPGGPVAGEPELSGARVARVGDMEVRRLIPLRRRRSVGAFPPVVGAQLRARWEGTGQLDLPPEHEHMIFTAAGLARVDDREVTPGNLLYLSPGRDRVTVTAASASTLVLPGGQPLGDPLLMWWNFVGRVPADIIEATQDWTQGTRSGQLASYRGAPLPAPPLDAVRLGRPRD